MEDIAKPLNTREPLVISGYYCIEELVFVDLDQLARALLLLTVPDERIC